MPPRRRLAPVVGKARNELRAALKYDGGTELSADSLVLVACSGGPDSLALASVAAYFGRTQQFRVGAVVVDHQLQDGSADVAARTAATLNAMGLDPVEVRTVSVQQYGVGPEAAARTARYAALDAAASQHGAHSVLLGHTLDDQAEQVLLGLARGSGTRSLAGMPVRRGKYLRPLLGLRRTEIEEICAVEGLDPWQDPSNADPAYLRSRVRQQVMPYLEETLGGAVATSLHRSARILAQDADYLDAVALAEYQKMVPQPDPGSETAGSETAVPKTVELPQARMRQLAPAIAQRVLALAVVELGGVQPSFERTLAAMALLERRGSAGPIELAGKVSVARTSRAGTSGSRAAQGKLVLMQSGR